MFFTVNFKLFVMRKIKIFLTSISVILFFGFTTKPKNFNNNLCGIFVTASNEASGSVRLYRVTWYDNNNQDVSSAVNLSSGQSSYLGDFFASNEISVQTKSGAFNNVTIEDGTGTALYSLPYNSSISIYWFHNVSFPSCGNYYIKLH